MDDTPDLAAVLDAYDSELRGEHLSRIRRHSAVLSDLAATFRQSKVRLLRNAGVCITVALAEAMHAELAERLEAN